jgi:hypothetical protein
MIDIDDLGSQGVTFKDNGYEEVVSPLLDLHRWKKPPTRKEIQRKIAALMDDATASGKLADPVNTRLEDDSDWDA